MAVTMMHMSPVTKNHRFTPIFSATGPPISSPTGIASELTMPTTEKCPAHLQRIYVFLHIGHKRYRMDIAKRPINPHETTNTQKNRIAGGSTPQAADEIPIPSSPIYDIRILF